MLKNNLNALVLAGGRSTRMQSDKGALQYHQKPQVQHLYDLIEPYVNEVYVSVRREQFNEVHLQGMNLLPDQFENGGPIGAILSAQTIFPDKAWLVVACDLPFINHQAIETLIEKRNLDKSATCFWNLEKQWPEPLITIWEPQSMEILETFFKNGKTCPRKALFNSDIEVIKEYDSRVIRNVNDPHDYQRTVRELNNLV